MNDFFVENGSSYLVFFYQEPEPDTSNNEGLTSSSEEYDERLSLSLS